MCFSYKVGFRKVRTNRASLKWIPHIVELWKVRTERAKAKMNGCPPNSRGETTFGNISIDMHSMKNAL